MRCKDSKNPLNCQIYIAFFVFLRYDLADTEKLFTFATLLNGRDG